MEFKTIRQTAAMGILNEHRLRVLVSEGRCPGMRAGNRFMVNVTALAEFLERESQAVCKSDEGEAMSEKYLLNRRGKG